MEATTTKRIPNCHRAFLWTFQTGRSGENDLKNARFERNRADYDPYPKNDLMFRPIAIELIQKAEDLLPVVRSYLKKKGCSL